MMKRQIQSITRTIVRALAYACHCGCYGCVSGTGHCHSVACGN
jgi:hypothetical protein